MFTCLNQVYHQFLIKLTPQLWKNLFSMQDCCQALHHLHWDIYSQYLRLKKYSRFTVFGQTYLMKLQTDISLEYSIINLTK